MPQKLGLIAPTSGVNDDPLVCLQFNADWIEAVMTALNRLESGYVWEDNADLEFLRGEVLKLTEQLNDAGACSVGETPTPYWDDADGTDADDQAPAETQDWYGVYDGDFTAQLTDWVLAGFIAYSGNIGAAIAFTTIAPKFRLAWKTGSLGGVIRIFINAADVGTVDTYSETAGILEKDFIGDPAETEQNIIQVLESVPT